MVTQKKILIIDDDREFLDEITEMLRTTGYKTVTLPESINAIDEVQRVKPDVILLDLKMDRMSGFEIAEELRGNPNTRNTPIIAITGVYTSKEYQLLTRIAGIKKCLIKPTNPLDVIAAIEGIVNHTDVENTG